MGALQYSPLHNRMLRRDAPDQLGVPTRRFLEAAVRDGDAETAMQWLDYYLLEMTKIRQIFGISDWDLVQYYLDRKDDRSLGKLLHESIVPWLGTTARVAGQPVAEVRVEGRNARFSVPGLSRTIHLIEVDSLYEFALDSPEAQATRWADQRVEMEIGVREGDLSTINRMLDSHVAEVRLLHDVLCDWEWGLMTVMARTWGEAALGDVLRATQERWVTTRYEKLRQMTTEDYLQLKAEEMRGHFSGPGWAGEFTVIEEPDRYLLAFDACGTGGRMRRGDPSAGSGSRLSPPYNFVAIEGAYPWAWNRTGVCGYCAHCAVVNQIMPIEWLGRPTRMTLYPEDPNEPCKWIIYKHSEDYPDEAYTSVGLSRKGGQASHRRSGRMNARPDRIALCGGGNAAHALIALLGSQGRSVSVFAPFGNEAERLKQGRRRAGGVHAHSGEVTWYGAPATISADPTDVFPDAELVILALPANAHRATLAAAAPYLRRDICVVALPARGGFDWEAADLLPGDVVIAGLQTLPWTCRVAPGRYGEEVHILGTKAVVDVAARPVSMTGVVATMLSELLCIPVQPTTSFLALALANTGQIIHPGIMYGLFGHWDGQLFEADAVPLFYSGVTDSIAEQMLEMSDEIQSVCSALAAAAPGLDFAAVLPLGDWLRRAYGNEIADPASLQTCFTTNRAYQTIQAPMTKVSGDRRAPFWETRYLTEDVPFGLLVTRGIAELCDVPTPAIDRVVEWAQSAISQVWLVSGELRGPDVARTRAPQRFGIHDLPQLLSHS